MSKREELYSAIISLGLQDVCKAKYGKNYTNCGNQQLEDIIKKHTSKKSTPSAPSAPSTPVSVSTPTAPVEKKENKVVTAVTGSSSLNKLIEILSRKRILLKSEVDEIVGS